MTSGAAAINRRRIDDALLRTLLAAKLGKGIDAAGDLDQLRDPADAADQRIVPFLEIDFWPRWRCERPQRRPSSSLRCSRSASASALAGSIDQGADGADHRKDTGDVALVEDVDGDAGLGEVGGELSLQVGKGQHQVRLERQDLRNIGGDERGNPWLLLAHLRRPHRVAGHADDPVLLAEEVEGFDRFLGQADDPAWRKMSHRSNRDVVRGAGAIQSFVSRRGPDHGDEPRAMASPISCVELFRLLHRGCALAAAHCSALQPC